MFCLSFYMSLFAQFPPIFLIYLKQFYILNHMMQHQKVCTLTLILVIRKSFNINMFGEIGGAPNCGGPGFIASLKSQISNSIVSLRQHSPHNYQITVHELLDNLMF